MKTKYYVIPLLLLLLTGCGKKELVCLNGYTLNEQDSTCERTIIADAKSVYHCEGANETLDGQQCRKVILTPADATLMCNDGYIFSDGLCSKLNTIYNFAKCGTDSTYDSNEDKCYVRVEPTTSYYCASGQLEGSNCATITYEKAEIEYVCDEENYKLQGDKCYYVIVTDAKETK